jgi:hypothetical protein
LGAGAVHIPLSYLIQEHEAVEAGMHGMAQYKSVDDYMIATTILSGNHFKIDNTHLNKNLKPLVIKGAG